jgi:hypothetical protein
VADSDKPTPGGDAGALSEAYERLRDAVLSGGAGGWRLGHGVLSARGMTAWMTAVGELAPPVGGTAGAATVAGAPRCAGCERLAGQPVALPHAEQIVAVLTQMVLPLAA